VKRCRDAIAKEERQVAEARHHSIASEQARLCGFPLIDYGDTHNMA
jgi:hypothetical protein